MEGFGPVNRGRLAQLDRARGFEPRGQGFESLTAHLTINVTVNANVNVSPETNYSPPPHRISARETLGATG